MWWLKRDDIADNRGYQKIINRKRKRPHKNVNKGDGADNTNNSLDHLSSALSSALASCNSVLNVDVLKDLNNSLSNFPSDKLPKMNENNDEQSDHN